MACWKKTMFPSWHSPNNVDLIEYIKIYSMPIATFFPERISRVANFQRTFVVYRYLHGPDNRNLTFFHVKWLFCSRRGRNPKHPNQFFPHLFHFETTEFKDPSLVLLLFNARILKKNLEWTNIVLKISSGWARWRNFRQICYSTVCLNYCKYILQTTLKNHKWTFC